MEKLSRYDLDSTSSDECDSDFDNGSDNGSGNNYSNN